MPSEAHADVVPWRASVEGESRVGDGGDFEVRVPPVEERQRSLLRWHAAQVVRGCGDPSRSSADAAKMWRRLHAARRSAARVGNGWTHAAAVDGCRHSPRQSTARKDLLAVVNFRVHAHARRIQHVREPDLQSRASPGRAVPGRVRAGACPCRVVSVPGRAVSRQCTGGVVRAACPLSVVVRAVLAQIWAGGSRSSAHVQDRKSRRRCGPVPAQMWASPGAVLGQSLVPAQMRISGVSRRRCERFMFQCARIVRQA